MRTPEPHALIYRNRNLGSFWNELAVPVLLESMRFELMAAAEAQVAPCRSSPAAF